MPVGSLHTGMKFAVAVDGSDESDRALHHALDVAGAFADPAAVVVVHAVAPDVYEEGGVRPVTDLGDAEQRLLLEGIEDAEERGEQVLADAASLASDRGMAVETDLLYGDPAERLPEYLEGTDFDALFVGHRSRSERAARALGSVATHLVERAPIPVTVVR